MVDNRLGRNIRKLRKDRGWTSDELAAKAGLSSVRGIEIGQRANPRTATLYAIAKALGVEVGTLWEEGGDD